MHLFCNRVPTTGHSRSSRVDDFGTNRKCIWNFLLVSHSNLGPILHCLGDTVTYLTENGKFSYPSHSTPPFPMFPLDVHDEVNHKETRVLQGRPRFFRSHFPALVPNMTLNTITSKFILRTRSIWCPAYKPDQQMHYIVTEWKLKLWQELRLSNCQ